MNTGLKTMLEEDIHAALMMWIDTIEGCEITKLPEVVYQDQDLVWIGTDKEDWLRGYAELKKAIQAQNNALHNIQIKVTEETIHTSPDENFAWVTNQWMFSAQKDGQNFELPLRCTWIVEKREASWRIVHFHKSAGIAS
jgi:ketosteroid isomerase-like protein